MGGRQLRTFYARHARAIHCTILVAACLAIYANAYDHAFNLDSGDGLVNNSYVRDLGYVPRYFVDPQTLTSLRANPDYRPVLQVSYALNYALSGYDMGSWHLVQVLLHAACALALYGFCRRLVAASAWSSSALADAGIAFGAALVFALHPVAAGVVDYLWARSSLLVAALLLPSFLLYMRPGEGESELASHRVIPWGAALLYALALFTKVEAVGALAVYFFFDALLRPRRVAASGGAEASRAVGESLLGDLLAALNVRTLWRLWPFLAVTAGYLVVRVAVMPAWALETRHAADVGSWSYLLTQLTAWWHYVLRWLAPVRLVADDLAYPVYRSLLEPRVLLALGGWLTVALVVRALYRRYPEPAFLGLSALALISPTSSILPISEMVNEHRPYLPLALLSLAWLIPALAAVPRLARAVPAGRALAAACGVLLLASLAALTYERNRVFASTESYWRDIEEKAPSARSALNYGRELMARGDYDGALQRFRASLELAPYWHVTHINLGVLYQQLGQDAEALGHYDRAVEHEQYSSRALVYRGRFHLARHRYQAALDDFEASLERARERFEIYKGMATADAGLGRWRESLEATRRCLRLDPAATELAIVEISTPYWSSPELYAAGVEYYRALDELLPGRWWIHQNLGELAAKLGREELAARAFERAAELRQGPDR